jgi:PAP2 superfamily
MRFLPVEKFAVTIIVALAALDVGLLVFKGVDIDLPGYIRVLSIGGLLVGVGQFYRRFRLNEAIALPTTAAGLFIVFTIVGSVFNYLLFPLVSTPIDTSLVRVDSLFGFHWPSFVEVFLPYPMVSTALKFVYLSSLLQLICVILLLGFTMRREELHRFLSTGIIGALLTICFWAVFPSFGTSTIHQIPTETALQLGLVVNSAYGDELVRLAAYGVERITPEEVLGLIAFPSFHTVMACMSVWFTRSLRKIWPLFIVLNLIMLPSILLHGGHHLSDVFGGLFVFAAALWLSGVLMRRYEADEAKQIGAVARLS